MNPEHHPELEAWAEDLAEAEPPPGFDERVMAAVRRRAAQEVESAVVDWWARPWFRAVAWTAASLVFALRFVASALVLWVG